MTDLDARARTGTTVLVGDVRLAGGRKVDITVVDGTIAAVTDVAPGVTAPTTSERVDGRGWLCTTAFVEPHFHLDKCFDPMGSHPRSSLAEVLAHLTSAKAGWTVADVADRAEAAARLLASLGVGAVRSFADVDRHCGTVALTGVAEAARRVRSVIDVQVVAFAQHGYVDQPEVRSAFRAAVEEDLVDAVGGHPQLEPTERDGRRQVEALAELALDHDLALDLHVDETDDPASTWLRTALAVAADPRLDGRITVGHACSLGSWPAEDRAAVVDEMARRSVSLVSSPTSGLLFRHIDHPQPPRGIAPVRDLLASGVNVAVAQEVYRSVFSSHLRFPDPLRSAALMGYVAQLSDPWGVDQLARMVQGNAAQAIGRPRRSVEVGQPADLVLLEAASMPDALTTAPRRVVLHGGRPVPPMEVDLR